MTVRDMCARLRLEAPGSQCPDMGVRYEAAEMLERLDALINNPHTDNFLDAVRMEAAHQRERWPTDHDADKDASQWFWLIGYLAGKAIRPSNTHDKRLHHIITTAAALLNWHRSIVMKETCWTCDRCGARSVDLDAPLKEWSRAEVTEGIGPEQRPPDTSSVLDMCPACTHLLTQDSTLPEDT